MVRLLGYLMLSLTLSGRGVLGGDPEMSTVKERIALLGLKNKVGVKEDELIDLQCFPKTSSHQ